MREDARVLNVDIDKLIPPEVQRDAPEDFELWTQHERAWWWGWRGRIGSDWICLEWK